MIDYRKPKEKTGTEVRPKKLIKEKLEIENVKIERAHRIGKEERGDPSQKRTIIATFLRESTAIVQVLQTLGGKVTYK